MRMEQNRCVFCMHEIDEENQLCPVCGRGIWEYEWEENWLEPETVLQERYYIGAVMGKGHSSVTYLGYDLTLEQKVVIKEYAPIIWEQKKQEEAAKIFGAFQVQGLVMEKDYFTDGQKGYIITEYLEGTDLCCYLKKQGKIAYEDAVELLKPAMAGVTFLHSIGMIHGAICPQHLIFDGEGSLRLTGMGEAEEGTQKECTMYLPPEQWEGVVGPWTDVYALCAVLYEMVTGRKIPAARDRIKRDRLKRPSVYIPVNGEEESVLMQGLSLDAQRRYFSVSVFAEQLGVGSREIQRLEGAIRHQWGEAWLHLTTQAESTCYGEYQKRRTIRWRKAVIFVGVMFCLAGGGAAFFGTHQNLIFQYKLEQAQRRGVSEERVSYLMKGAKNYETIRTFVEKYGEESQEYDHSAFKNYSIPEEALKKCSTLRGTYGVFCLDKDTMLDAIAYNMGIHKKDVSQKDSIYHGNVRIYQDNTETMDIGISQMEEYVCDYNNLEENIRLTYDAMNYGVKSIEFKGTKERCEQFLIKMIPFLSPETYLTEKEAREILNAPEEDDSIKIVDLTAKCSLMVSNHNFKKSETYSVTLSSRTSKAGSEKNKEKEAGVYAGNYVRGSERYEAFKDYVADHAISMEKTDGAEGVLDEKDNIVYTLDTKSVEEWGEPSNAHRFSIKRKELMKALEERGYALTKTSEKEKNTVTIRKYGAIITLFQRNEYYESADGVCVAIASDILNEDVMIIKVYRQDNRSDGKAKTSADISQIVSEAFSRNKEEVKQHLKETESKVMETGDTWFVDHQDCMVMITKEEECTAFFFSPIELFRGSDYYWP